MRTLETANLHGYVEALQDRLVDLHRELEATYFGDAAHSLVGAGVQTQSQTQHVTE